jgi:hypothetical protein
MSEGPDEPSAEYTVEGYIEAQNKAMKKAFKDEETSSDDDVPTAP